MMIIERRLVMDCKDCEFFISYDYSDGTPICECDGGYEKCPYNLTGAPEIECENNKRYAHIDLEGIEEYISHNIISSLSCNIDKFIQSEISQIIRDEYDSIIKTKTREAVDNMIDSQIKTCMAKEITIGGGWNKEARTVTREQYLSEIIGESLEKNLDNNQSIKNEIDDFVRFKVQNFSEKLKAEINTGLKTTFDNATRQVLADNVVQMLMCSDTYKQLSNSMENLLSKGGDQK